ncbi:hypothetical protein LJC51_10875, partial [Lachnospiraceae bacterium OttesenSCG-928-J05]|nr:hypothetical protein [Lachnospiraceae bacterium OttesenSCG-928-J05]
MKIEQRIKKTIAVILILVFLTQQIPAIPAYASGNTSVWDGSIASAYASGTGSEADPYIIKSASQFARISQEVSCGNEVDKYYELSADVDLNSLNWIPIGNDEYPFKGYFNGKGHVITNMHVSAIQSGTTKSKRTLFDVRLEDVGKSRSKENVIVEDPITKELIQQTRELDDEIKKVAEEERRIVEENTEKSKARESDNNRNENVESPIAPSNEGNIKEQQVEEPLLGIEKQEESIEEVGDEILDEGKKEEKDLEPDEEVEIEEFSEADEEEPKEGVKDELADIVKDEGAGSNEDVSNVNSDGIQMAKSELNKIENAFKEEVEDGNRKKASRATSYATQFPGYEADAGLFGYFYSGVIESVFVTNSGVTGQRYCGGIAGYSGTNAVIKKCYFDGVVDSSISGCIGGIVGYSEGRINVCYNRGTIGQYSGSGSYVGGIVGGSGFVTESMNTGNIYGNNSYMGGISGTIIGNKMVLECINYGSVGTSVTQGGFVGGIVGHAKDGYVSKSANHGKVMATSSSSANCFIGGLAGDAYVVSNSYNVAEVSGCWAAGLGGVLIGGSLKSYNAGTIEGEMNAAVTCLLEANGTVSRNSTFFRQDSAPIAIRHNAAGFLGGVAVGVRADLMKDINWIEGVLQTPFVIDSNNINNGYAILDVVNYTPDEPRPIEGHMKEDTFHFASAREKGSPEEYDDYEGMFYYSDAYFRSDASIYNPSLATMSLCLAISGFNSNSWGPTGDKYKNKHKNVEELMDKIGFSEIAVSADYEIKPEKNTFGVVVGHKEVQVDGRKKSLIVLVGRGGGYEAEWGGNLTLGETGEHKGFSDAKDVAYNHLADYVMQHRDESWFHEEDVLFWITGYSRAAAVTNLLSGQLTTELSISGVSFSNEDLYAYCMAPPMGAIEGVSEQADKIYTNIHN